MAYKYRQDKRSHLMSYTTRVSNDCVFVVITETTTHMLPEICSQNQVSSIHVATVYFLEMQSFMAQLRNQYLALIILIIRIFVIINLK